MKKYIITLIFALGVILNLNAQSDSFFTSNYREYREIENDWGIDMPMIPASHGHLGDYDCANVPLGSGFLILAVLGVAYGIRKKNS